MPAALLEKTRPTAPAPPSDAESLVRARILEHRGRCLASKITLNEKEWLLQCNTGHEFSLTTHEIVTEDTWCQECEHSDAYVRYSTV